MAVTYLTGTAGYQPAHKLPSGGPNKYQFKMTQAEYAAYVAATGAPDAAPTGDGWYELVPNITTSTETDSPQNPQDVYAENSTLIGSTVSRRQHRVQMTTTSADDVVVKTLRFLESNPLPMRWALPMGDAGQFTTSGGEKEGHLHYSASTRVLREDRSVTKGPEGQRSMQFTLICDPTETGGEAVAHAIVSLEDDAAWPADLAGAKDPAAA